jgi:hypothetical protein
MAADTKTLDRIKSLRREAAAIGGFNDLYSEKYAPDSHCDKKGYGFNRDDRFAAFSVNIFFESHAGYYGNSSCSRILNVYDTDAVKAAFVKALGVHQKELFQTMASLMREEAASLIEQAETEIAALQAMLDQARAEPIIDTEPAADAA